MGYRFAISVAAAVVIALLVAVPEQALSAMPAVCFFRRFLGFECPGCGMTRALSAAAHGRFAAAFALNAGVVVVVPALFAAALQGLRPPR